MLKTVSDVSLKSLREKDINSREARKYQSFKLMARKKAKNRHAFYNLLVEDGQKTSSKVRGVQYRCVWLLYETNRETVRDVPQPGMQSL